jgi:hypothetical protein
MKLILGGFLTDFENPSTFLLYFSSLRLLGSLSTTLKQILIHLFISRKKLFFQHIESFLSILTSRAVFEFTKCLKEILMISKIRQECYVTKVYLSLAFKS